MRTIRFILTFRMSRAQIPQATKGLQEDQKSKEVDNMQKLLQ